MERLTLSDLKDNEKLFKNMVITFSEDNINKSIQEVLQKKADYNLKVLSQIGSILQNLSEIKNQKIIKNIQFSLNSLISTSFKDTEIIIGSYNIVLQDLINKNKSLSEDKSGSL